MPMAAIRSMREGEDCWPGGRQASSPRLLSGNCSFTALVLERELYLHPVGQRFPRLDVDVLLDNAGDPQVPQGLGSSLNGGGCRFLPRLGAGSHQLDHLVDAFCHMALLSFKCHS